MRITAVRYYPGITADDWLKLGEETEGAITLYQDDLPDRDCSPGNENMLPGNGNLDEAYKLFCERVGGDLVWSKTRLHHYFNKRKMIAPYFVHEVEGAVKSAQAGEDT